MIQEKAAEEIRYPSIIFKLCGETYSIDSRRVTGIMQMPEYSAIPDSPPYVSGVFNNRGEAIILVDLRAYFSMPTLKSEYNEFTEMVDARKQDHVNWVEALEHSIKTGTRFTLATDPHQCKLGLWYDHFHSDSDSVNHHLSKLETPHRLLHEAALEVEKCNQKSTAEAREACVTDLLNNVKEQYMPRVLELLEEAKMILRDSYREMVLIVRDEQPVGLIVDEVVAVEEIAEVETGNTMTSQFYGDEAIRGIKQREIESGLIFGLDEMEILRRLRAENLKLD